MRSCLVDGCDKAAKARGLCGGHWYRWRKYGDPTLGVTGKGEPNRFLHDVVFAYQGDECLIWPYGKTKGYARINGHHTSEVCRLVCEKIYGSAPTDRHQAAHSCGNGHKGCCAPSHLRWATSTENMRDQYFHGTRVMGERHGGARLRDEDILAIRSVPKSFTSAAIAKQFGMSRRQIADIRRGIAWSHVRA